MKKTKLTEAVSTYQNEMEYVIRTIIESITAKGQRKKLLQDDKVKEILERYHIEIDA